jgi:hypothetical protein
MVICAAMHGGARNQHSICKERVMSDTNGTGFMNEITLEDTVTSEVVELGDVVAETKGAILGTTLDTLNAYMYVSA